MFADFRQYFRLAPVVLQRRKGRRIYAMMTIGKVLPSVLILKDDDRRKDRAFEHRLGILGTKRGVALNASPRGTMTNRADALFARMW